MPLLLPSLSSGKFRRYSSSRLILALVLALVLLPYSVQDYSPAPSEANAGFFTSDLEVFGEVLDLVTDKYVYPPDFKKIFGSAIDSMLERVPEGSVEIGEHGDSRTLDKGGSRASYQLTFSRRNNMRALQLVYNFLLRNYPEQLKPRELESHAIKGMMKALDTYSLYMDPKEFEDSMRDTEGQYGGLGMVITMEDYQLTVVKTMKDSPAERAGLKKGDIIREVDGQKIKGMQIQELASKLRGYPDTEVHLAVFRPATEKVSRYTMIREIIAIETIVYQDIGDHTGYVKISSFSKKTNDQLEDALEKAHKSGAKAFIIDLRNNPGGLLNQSVMVASHFLEQGKLIVYTRGRHTRDSQEYEAMYEESESKFPVAVLINNHSASASEIVAGSLHDSGKAILIGENSYGKGSVQTIFKMSDGSGLRLTTSKYFTPSGIDITAHGIEPQIHITHDLNLPAEDALPPSGKISPSEQSKSSPKGLVLKESELEAYLKSKGVSTKDGEIDSLVRFAQMVLKDSASPTRSHALARARELAKDIHY